MLTTKKTGDDHITVIPYCPHCACHYRNPIVVYKLCFWFNGKIDHVVTEESIQQFLHQVNLFGATIYPDFPELGCYAINNDPVFSPAGKTGVSEILYKGEVIYSHNLHLFTNGNKQSKNYEKPTNVKPTILP